MIALEMNDIRNLKDVVEYIELMIEREKRGDDPIDIALDITDLMSLDVVYDLKKKYPQLEDLLEASADLEVNRKVVYASAGELWGRIKAQTSYLRNIV